MRSGKWGVTFTTEEVAPVGEAARVVGGYDELLRMERERRSIVRRGQQSQVVRDASGRYSCQPAPEVIGAARKRPLVARIAAWLRPDRY